MKTEELIYKSLINLLRNHENEVYLPKRNKSGVVANCKLEGVKECLKSTNLSFSRKFEIYVFCSLVHTNSAIVFKFAQKDLQGSKIDLGLTFSQTSSSAVKEFKKATAAGFPALVTVTEGTQKILQQSQEEFGRFLEVQPGALKWAATKEVGTIESANFSQLQFTCYEHPTDINAFQKFENEHLLKTQKQSNLVIINESPESLNIISKCKKNEVLLVNPFMASWAAGLIHQSNSLFFLEGWQETESRFIYGNNYLWQLADANGFSVAHYLQLYLAEKFENLRRVKRDFLNDDRLKKGEFIKQFKTDYFNC